MAMTISIRLTSEAITSQTINGTISYTYDHVGNRLSRTSFPALEDKVPSVPSYTYDADDRLGGDTYDENGKTLQGQGSTPQTANDQYDFEDRLINRNKSKCQFLSFVHLTVSALSEEAQLHAATASHRIFRSYLSRHESG